MVWNSCAIFEIVGGGERLLAQIVEGEARHPHGRARHLDGAALHRESRCGSPAWPPVSRCHASSSAASAARVGRDMPDRRAGELLQPEIGARVEPDHLHVLLDQRDERQEQRAVEPVLVELARAATFEVATTTTPSSNSRVNSRPRIIASAMSVTWNSSKHRSQVSSRDRRRDQARSDRRR